MYKKCFIRSESGYKFAKAKEKRKIVSLFLFVSIRRRHRVLGGTPPKKLGRLCQTNDMLATFKKQRKEGGKGANNENKKRTGKG